MDNLELLSDDELRRRLLQYGFPNLPITATTRKTLIKKLRNHLSNTASSLRKTTSLVTRYSSGEESDVTDKTKTSKTKRQGRITVSGSQTGQLKTPSPPLFNSFSQPPAKTSFTRIGNTSSGSGRNVYVSPVIINDSEDDDLDWSLKRSRSNNSLIKNSQSRNINSSRTLDSTFDVSQKTNGSNGYDNEDDEEDTNTTSDYTKRLLQFREGNAQKLQPSQPQLNNNNNLRKRPSYMSQRMSEYQAVNENDIVYHAEPFLETAHVPLSLAIKNFINRLDAAYGLKQTFVPMVLVTFLVIFFTLIIFMYITISPNIEKTLSPSTTIYFPCDGHHDMEATFACIDEQNLLPSLNLLKVLASELQKRAVLQKCGKVKDISSVMCVKDFWHYINDNHLSHHKHNQDQSSTTSVLDVMKDLHNIEYLVDRNKQWGIYNVDNNGKPISLDDVVNQRAHQAECFAILSPKLPLTCTLYNKLQTFFTIIGTLAILLFAGFFGRKFYYFILNIKEKRKAQVNQIMNEIIRLLMEKTVMDKDNAFLVVNHLRDKIIEPSRKNELSWAWQESISYLEKHDSRVHFGFENINGEDFKVIRWIDDVKNLPGTNNHSQQQQGSLQQQQQTSSRFSSMRYSQAPQPFNASLKRWMCPAFDKSNKISDPPTNCLKIRNMFEKYETNSPNLQSIIQDTILHKVCEKGCKIYDIQLDLKTCCTYVKCSSCVDAGIVHEEINGWWLINGDDNRLVVVKFLKQDKYHQRFPSSINACSIMYPASSPIPNNYVTNGHDFGDDIDDEEDNDDFE
ncbi:unnamed protein product [Chironomus riparius]|uniref:LEM domain-containing protein n=1 Tax=Chironomus riparius TaxID=315576 RepID=A0A9N9RW24_9DIPT|nr:unnamed protein product [Chironomus riparius]